MARTPMALAIWLMALTTANGQENPIKPVAATAAQASFDQPLAWMKEAKENFGAVKDFSCLLTTRESVNGKLSETGYVQFKMMTQPFSVHMRWIAPQKLVGQEVIYVDGKNNGKMLVKSPSLPKALGFISIPVDDPRVMKNSRHTIREAGIGNMIHQTLDAWTMERALGKTMIKDAVAETFNGVPCIKLEVVRFAFDKRLPYSRSVLRLEKTSKMPIHLENYGWASAGAQADLLEEFSYREIRWNTGLKDADFSK